MATPEQTKDLTRLLGSAGRAHHEAFGGPNPEWPEWYATFLVDNGISTHVGFDPDVEVVADWLCRADEQHRSEASEERWPPYYAALIFDWVESTD
jgi:hypothetical protein